MGGKNSSERLAEAMARASSHEQTRLAETPAFTIALSREAGANAAPVTRALGERLGWPVYDRELLQRIAGEMGVRATLLESMDERRKGWLQECLEAFGSGSTVSESAYVRRLVETLLALASHGECVLVGRGAPQLLPPATTLRVRLVGPVADRVKVVRQRFGISEEEAARWVTKTDAERARFVKDHFRKDPTDPRLYDLVLNSARLSAGECADLIVEALRRLQARARAGRAELVKA
jgi:cytidylate kinase